ncbi:lytic transglycosylase domain-containing protein [Aquabacterium humicola]|uniref:lytic transglycosylase domain-containing protein n=1 Tax=Aquabacterium humicola TaxID=3237377 RepID=UPI002543EE27|nr:lytic transglycosylase domain-containing protein [Rubrivivax pictus]
MAHADRTSDVNISRRRAVFAIAALHPPVVLASSRLVLEEDLVDAVRSSLSAELEREAPPKPSFEDPAERLAYDAWHARSSERLRSYLPEDEARGEFVDTVWYESRRAGLETGLVLGLIHVESAFRRYAISPVGARGYMQIMPFWAQLLGAADASKLFHVQTNMRFGCSILRHYLERERGNLTYALGRYNGRRDGQTYPALVFDRRDRWPSPSPPPPPAWRPPQA